jgi:ABC-type tungstate transport system permease subunit
MEMYLGQKAKHYDLYNGKEVFEIIGVKENEVLLKGDFSGGTHNVEQESWMPIKGLILQNRWGAWIDPINDIDFTKGAGPRDF